MWVGWGRSTDAAASSPPPPHTHIITHTLTLRPPPCTRAVQPPPTARSCGSRSSPLSTSGRRRCVRAPSLACHRSLLLLLALLMLLQHPAPGTLHSPTHPPNRQTLRLLAPRPHRRLPSPTPLLFAPPCAAPRQHQRGARPGPDEGGLHRLQQAARGGGGHAADQGGARPAWHPQPVQSTAAGRGLTLSNQQMYIVYSSIGIALI